MVNFETWKDWCVQVAREKGVAVRQIGYDYVVYRNLNQHFFMNLQLPYLEEMTTHNVKKALREAAVQVYTGIPQ
jgi:hypothetical protein